MKACNIQWSKCLQINRVTLWNYNILMRILWDVLHRLRYIGFRKKESFYFFTYINRGMKNESSKKKRDCVLPFLLLEIYWSIKNKRLRLVLMINFFYILNETRKPYNNFPHSFPAVNTYHVSVWEMALTSFKAFIFCSFSIVHRIPNQHTVELMDSRTTDFFRSWWRYNSICTYIYIQTHTILIRLNHQTSLIDTHACYDVITRTWSLAMYVYICVCVWVCHDRVKIRDGGIGGI